MKADPKPAEKMEPPPATPRSLDSISPTSNKYSDWEPQKEEPTYVDVPLL